MSSYVHVLAGRAIRVYVQAIQASTNPAIYSFTVVSRNNLRLAFLSPSLLLFGTVLFFLADSWKRGLSRLPGSEDPNAIMFIPPTLA